MKTMAKNIFSGGLWVNIGIGEEGRGTDDTGFLPGGGDFLMSYIKNSQPISSMKIW